MDHLFTLEVAFQSGSLSVLHAPCWKYRKNVSDWSGSTNSWEQQKQLPEQFKIYLRTVHQIFHENGMAVPVDFDKLTLRILLEMVLSRHPDMTMLRHALFHVCFKRYISVRNNINLLRDLCYIFRRH